MRILATKQFFVACVLIALLIFYCIAYIKVSSEESTSNKNSQSSELKNSVEKQDLKSGEYAESKGADLQKLDPKKIEIMQIFSLEKVGDKLVKRYTNPPLSSRAIRGILALCKKASTEPPGHVCEPLSNNYAMVVKLVNGDIFEIKYSDYLHEPFGGLYSMELKQALYSVGGHGGNCSIIKFNEGKVVYTKHSWVPSENSKAGGGLSLSMCLNEQGQIMIHVELLENDKDIVDDSQPMQYGEAKTFSNTSEGHVIVLLNNISW